MEIDSHSMLSMGSMLQMGKYRIDSYLSSGGFGNTYVVTNLQFDERMAMKEFFMKGISERNPDQTTVSVSNGLNQKQFDQQRNKFKKEARRLRKLNNDRIVRVHDLFDENGTSYYIMDFVEGESLSDRLRRTGKPMTEAEVRNVLMQVLSALKEVHANGIWHLDLKPGNILVDDKGNVKVIDFGASKQTGAEADGATTFSMCYTPCYAPTEQIEQNMDRIGPWTDFFALGATLYNLLTNLKPPQISEIADGGSFHYPVAVSQQMRELIKWMMTPTRSKRPQSADEVLQFLDQQSVPARAKTAAADVTYYNTHVKTGSGDEKKEVASKGSTPRRFMPVKPSGHDVVKPNQGFEFNRFVNSYGKFIVGAVAGLALLVLIFVLFKGSSSEGLDGSGAGHPEMVKDFAYTTAIGDCKYTGPLDEAKKPNGFGEAFFTDGRYYKGFFVHGVLEGDSAYFMYPSKNYFYGRFKNNYFSFGHFVMHEDSSYFYGTFDKNGQPAEGNWFDKNNKLILDDGEIESQ